MHPVNHNKRTLLQSEREKKKQGPVSMKTETSFVPGECRTWMKPSRPRRIER